MHRPLPAGRHAPSSCVSVADLKRFADGWVLESEYRQLSRQTLYSRRSVTKKLLWWLAQQEYESCGTMELRGFLTYVSNGDEKNGRWANPNETAKNCPVTAAT